MIQLGVPIADAPPEDESASGISKDRRTEPIPAFLEDVIERLLTMQVVSVKPDSCIIDIFNEGDFSQPHIWPQLFSRPVCVLFLTECDMTFGKVITADHPGDYRGSLKLSVSPGSMLVMQGRSADFTRHAMPSIGKQRMLVTMTKLQPKKTAPSDVQRFPSSVPAPPSHWAPPLSRSPNHIRHPAAPKHYGPVPTTGVLPAPTARPQVPSPNGIQPIFVPAPVAPAMPFPAPVAVPPASTGWSIPPSRHPPPRLPLPGTGVFLPPPGSGNTVNQPISTPATENITADAPSLLEKDNDSQKLNGNNGTSREVDWKDQSEECNGNIDGTSRLRVTTEEHQNVDCVKPAAAV
ncbi:hydroxyproline-rich glycoprotein family protein [Abeliophyllum distichum]|uniref:Hydroxyproline-rich glycoprotein family protein n=1 Tax=Abeliophyllum distichum TaxID=126358 RepID=A0ABD1VVN3_9LAMI